MVIKNSVVTNAQLTTIKKAETSAAVNDDDEDFIVGHARFESVDEFATRHLRESFGDLRHDAAGDVDDFIFLRVGHEGQRSAEAAAARLNDNCFVISHFKSSSSSSRLQSFAERNALLFLNVSGAEVGDPAAQEVNHDTDKQITQSQVDVVQSERRDAVGDAEVNEKPTA